MGRMGELQVTVVVTARERFSAAIASLDNVLATAGCPMRVIYMDAGSPRYVRDHLATRVKSHGIEVVSCREYQAPNVLRNRALAMVTTPYVAFIDNDIFCKDGWLERLVACAGTTGATLVSPLICLGPPLHENVHIMGGVCRIVDRGPGKRYITVKQGKQDIPVAQAEVPDAPFQSEAVEYHTLLVRTEHFRKHGPLDENILTFCEEVDLALGVQATGGTTWIEPRSVITYEFPQAFAWSDIPWFFLRWSDRWLIQSISHLESKWGADRSPAFDALVRGNGWMRRQLVFKPIAGLLPKGRVKDAIKGALRGIERALMGTWLARRPAADRADPPP